MGTKKLIPYIGFALCLSSCSLVTKSDPPLELTLFNKYGLAICLGAGFPHDEVKDDFNKAANGYMISANMPLESYEEIRGLIRVWMAKDYKSKHGGQIVSMKCIDMVSSPEFQNIYTKYDPCKNKETWLDNSDYRRQCL